MKPKTELQHHLEVATWLKRKYPDVIFRTDYSAGLKLTIGQAKVHNRLQHGKGYPDLWIAKAIYPFHGLYIELKKDGTTIILKNGQLTADKHIREQAVVLGSLFRAGYGAAFAIGHLQAKQIIDDYMKGEVVYPLKYLDGEFMPITTPLDNPF